MKKREPEVLRVETVVTESGDVFTMTIYKPKPMDEVFARVIVPGVNWSNGEWVNDA